MAVTYIVKARRFYRAESELGLFAVVADNEVGDFNAAIAIAKEVSKGILEQGPDHYTWSVENVVAATTPVASVIYHRVTEE